MRAESWEWINLNWWPSENQTEKTPELLRMGEKNSHNQIQLWEDIMKLEPRIFERTDKIEDKLFLGLQVHRMMMRKTTMNCWDTPGWRLERLNQRWKEFERSWRNTFDWWQFILTSNFEMDLSITPEKEELGKILEKDMLVMAHSRETPLNDLKGRLRRSN